LIEHRVHINEDNHVDDQAERAELIFLAFPVALVKFAAFAMKDIPCKAVAAFGKLSCWSVLRRRVSSSMKFSVCMVLSMRPTWGRYTKRHKLYANDQPTSCF
jgi:hypothetical protein